MKQEVVVPPLLMVQSEPNIRARLRVFSAQGSFEKWAAQFDALPGITKPYQRHYAWSYSFEAFYIWWVSNLEDDYTPIFTCIGNVVNWQREMSHFTFSSTYLSVLIISSFINLCTCGGLVEINTLQGRELVNKWSKIIWKFPTTSL